MILEPIKKKKKAFGKVQLAEMYPVSLRKIKKKFPVSIDIIETECNSMKTNLDRLLLKKEYYNEYCLVEIHNGTEQLGFTIFKSDWKDFDKIENDFMKGFSFAPKYHADVYIIMETLL